MGNGSFFLYSIFLSVVVFVLILLLYFLQKQQVSLNSKASVAEKTLEEHARVADRYELAYLIGGVREVFHLAFYTLVKSGYLLKIEGAEEIKHKSYPPRYYLLDKQRDINALHEIEREIALSYDKDPLLPENAKEFISISTLLNKYELGLKELSLFPPPLKLWHNIEGISALAILFGFMPIITGLIIGLDRTSGVNILDVVFETWPPTLLTTALVYFIIRSVLIRKKLEDKFKNNAQKFISFFEKNHFPYPDFKQEGLADYLVMITPCGL